MHETSTLPVLFIAHEIVIFDPEATAGDCTVALAKRLRLNSTKKCSSWIAGHNGFAQSSACHVDDISLKESWSLLW